MIYYGLIEDADTAITIAVTIAAIVIKGSVVIIRI